MIAEMTTSQDAAASKRVSLTVYEVAEKLGVSHWCIRRAITAGTIKSFTVGKRRLVPVAEVSRLVGETAA